MTWSVEAILAIAARVARRTGRTPLEAYPVVRLRDRQLLYVYVRDVGMVPA